MDSDDELHYYDDSDEDDPVPSDGMTVKYPSFHEETTEVQQSWLAALRQACQVGFGSRTSFVDRQIGDGLLPALLRLVASDKPLVASYACDVLGEIIGTITFQARSAAKADAQILQQIVDLKPLVALGSVLRRPGAVNWMSAMRAALRLLMTSREAATSSDAADFLDAAVGVTELTSEKWIEDVLREEGRFQMNLVKRGSTEQQHRAYAPRFVGMVLEQACDPIQLVVVARAANAQARLALIRRPGLVKHLLDFIQTDVPPAYPESAGIDRAAETLACLTRLDPGYDPSEANSDTFKCHQALVEAGCVEALKTAVEKTIGQRRQQLQRWGRQDFGLYRLADTPPSEEVMIDRYTETHDLLKVLLASVANVTAFRALHQHTAPLASLLPLVTKELGTVPEAIQELWTEVNKGTRFAAEDPSFEVSFFAGVCSDSNLITMRHLEPHTTVSGNLSLLLKRARVWRKRANDAFGERDYETAMWRYTEALELLGPGWEPLGEHLRNREFDEDRSLLHTNRAETHLQLRQFSMALRDAQEAVRLCPKSKPEVLAKSENRVRRAQEGLASI